MLDNTMLDDCWCEVVDDIHENANDYDTLKIAYLLIQDEIHRLSYDLNNDSIKKEYNTLTTIELQLRDMILNYV